MKKIITSFLAVAAFAAAFTACSKDDAEATANAPREKNMTVVASSDLTTTDKMSRTVLDPESNTVSWNASGEYLKVFETNGSTTTPVTSAEAVISNSKATFGVTFTENTSAASFTYNAVYPASAWVDNNNTDVAQMKVLTPTTQQPTATSFDAAADLLIAYPETYNAQPSELNVRFARMVAIGKMTIKNLKSAENITSVKFTAANKEVTGRSFINLSEGVVTDYGYSGFSNDNVEMKYASALGLKSGMTAYFGCFPFELTSGETFTVTVTTPTKIFTREVTIAADRSLTFTAGRSTTFAVDMSTATEKANDTLNDGEYLIIAKIGTAETYEAMSATASGTRLKATAVSYDGKSKYIETEDQTLVWTITKSGDNYTVANIGNSATNYLTWESGNGAKTGSDAYPLTITKNVDNTTYQIKSVATPARILARNQTGTYFAFYAGTQYKDLYLVKVGADPRTPIATPTNLDAIAMGNEIVVTWNAVTGAADYTVTCGNQSQTVTETTATFTLAYNTEYTINIVANPTDTESYKASAAATTTITTEVNPNPGGSTEAFLDSFSSTSGQIDANISYASYQGGGTSAPVINKNAIRLYQGSSTKSGGYIEITAAAGYKIQSITIGTTNTYSTTVKHQVDDGELSTGQSVPKNGTYMVDGLTAQKVSFHCYGTTSSTRLEIGSIKVTYTE